MFKKLLLFLLLLAVSLSAVFFIFKKDIASWRQASDNFIANDPAINSIKGDVKIAKDQIFTTNKPLRKEETNVKPGTLTISGVIKETNVQRELVNLNDLKESEILNRSAKLKLDDMFKQQYFEHISPDGKGPSDLAKAVNYEFVIVGENLALGNFKNDKDLLAGWMASPGHKENILRNGYEEIGVAVGQGMFEGEMTWLAVQEFGTPAKTCPGPDKMLAQLINDNKLELTKQELNMNNKKTELDNYNPKNNQTYATMVQEYNVLIERYNALANLTKLKVGEYNSQAETYNNCLQQHSK